MNNLMASLGLDQVSGDPNEIPDNTFDGIVKKDEFVFVKKSNSVNHVIEFEVTDGTYKGKSKAIFTRFGTDPVDANGQPTEKVDEIANYKHTMSDDNKNYYKALLLNLGVPAAVIDSGQFVVGSLKDTPVTFTTSTKNGYQNIYNVKVRQLTATPMPATLGGTPSPEAAAQPQATQAAPQAPQNLGNLV